MLSQLRRLLSFTANAKIGTQGAYLIFRVKKECLFKGGRSYLKEREVAETIFQFPASRPLNPNCNNKPIHVKVLVEVTRTRKLENTLTFKAITRSWRSLGTNFQKELTNVKHLCSHMDISFKET